MVRKNAMLEYPIGINSVLWDDGCVDVLESIIHYLMLLQTKLRLKEVIVTIGCAAIAKIDWHSCRTVDQPVLNVVELVCILDLVVNSWTSLSYLLGCNKTNGCCSVELVPNSKQHKIFCHALHYQRLPPGQSLIVNSMRFSENIMLACLKQKIKSILCKARFLHTLTNPNQLLPV